MVLILSSEDVAKVVSISELIKVVEEAFKELALRTAVMPPRQVITIPEDGGWVGVMPCYLKRMKALATKVVTVFRDNPMRFKLPTTLATMILNDPETGAPLAIMEGGFLTAMRTGAVSAVATKYLAREDSKVLGIFGAGVQARTQLTALCEVRRIKRAIIYDVFREASLRYADEMSRRIGLEVHVAETPLEAARDADIIVTASTSKTPVFKGEWLQAGVHINGIGSHTPNVREVDSETVKRSKLVVDSREAALKEAGDILIPINEGVVTSDHIYAELGEIVAGVKAGRESRDEVTLFKSCGLAIQDASAAHMIYGKAKAMGVGFEVRLI